MKNLILLACLIVSMCGFAQSEKQNYLEEIEVSPPHFTGIENVANLLLVDNSESVKMYMAKNVKYPEKSIENYVEGTEVIKFVVTHEGKVADIEVINSVSKEIDKEVIRVIEGTSGMWKPGLNNGVPTAMHKEVSMLFKVDETDSDAIHKHFTVKATHHFIKGGNHLHVTKHTKKALRHYNNAIIYLPNDNALLTLRGLCKYELGDMEGARRDWERINELSANNNVENKIDLLSYYDISELKGYAQMLQIVHE
jgi:TonB family protein